MSSHREQPNRLGNEKSPYLLQHAYNPVDWYPWGEEAMEKARAEDKPIFLSIGYSTCHWCHVMERESFENDEVARVLNEQFIPVKVDREERPDIDRIYMLFVQASTGSGGWPMSVWMTPEGKPFLGGTYFPPETRFGRPGFKAVLERLATAWREDRARIEDSGAQVIEQLRTYSEQAIEGAAGAAPVQMTPQETWDGTFNMLRRACDRSLGGFGQAPKFPRPVVHNFLFRYAETATDESIREDARGMVLKTLDAMAAGGMNDQLGGGFHRYSVDERWFVPHFEKMLYDQAQLAVSYLEAHQITGEEKYARVARDILDYVLRDLTHREGGFYSAEDADSAADPSKPKDKSEGAFYIWSHQELVEALGADDAAVFSKRYGVLPAGNVEQDPHGEFGGRNILYQARGLDEGEAEIIERASAKLLAIRGGRPRPHLDDKILAAWNGLMISAFAKGAQVLGDARYGVAARAARDFIRREMWREEDHTLLRRYRDGDAAIDGFLDDYAFLVHGLLDLYETDFDPADLAWAEVLAARAVVLFEDPAKGGFFSTPEAQSDLILRLKDDYDGAEPAGNSFMVLGLLRLSRFRDRDDFRAAAARALEAFGPKLAVGGTGLPQLLVAQMFAVWRPMEIVLAGPREELGGMLQEVRKRFLPGAIVMLAEDSPHKLGAINGTPTAYVCENYSCQLPGTSPELLAQQLQTPANRLQ